MRTWQEAEKTFKNYFNNRGKRSFVHQFPDTKTVVRAKAFIVAQPSDFIVTDEGQTFYAEVKFCQGETSFPFGSIQTGQWTAARRITAARGEYFFFIYSTKVATWFRVPALLLINHGKKSLKWTELVQHEWIPE